MHLFEVLWDDVLSQQNLPRYVRAATITLLANPGATLVDMHAFLLDEAVRRRMLQPVSDPTVRRFWEAEYERLSPAEQTRRIQPLTNRLEALFMGRSLVRNIVGQRRTSINFREAAEQRRIIFIKLPIKTVAQDARLIGTILIAQLSAAIFSFADLPEAQRPGVSLYVDEFQHFTTTDFSELFTEGRKFGVKVTVAHQYRGQLPDFLQESTMTARTKVIFQATPEDGRELAHLFPAQEATIRPEDIEAQAVGHLLERSTDYPAPVQTFAAIYLRPLQSYKRGGKVDIEGKQFTIDLWRGSHFEQVYVEEPTPYLNSLLYEVMRSGNTGLSIPWEATAGFANCGRGFFPAVKHAKGSRELTSQVEYPPHLVVNGRWMRSPETAQEQFLHFIFHLRHVMAYLAKHPVGKASAPSANAVGQMLTQLPRRAAFVRSGEDVGVIYTLAAPKRLSGPELTDRLRAIQVQTRVTYCHPRAEVERQILGYSQELNEQRLVAATLTPMDPASVPELAYAAPHAYPPRYARWEEVDGDDN